MSKDGENISVKPPYEMEDVTVSHGNSYCVHKHLSYEEALKRVKIGTFAMRLPFWDTDVIVFAVEPGKGSLINVPYLCIVHEDKRTPWIPSQIFDNDWQIVEILDYLQAFKLKQL